MPDLAVVFFPVWLEAQAAAVAGAFDGVAVVVVDRSSADIASMAAVGKLQAAGDSKRWSGH
jgi:hypothetical protein